MAQVTVAQFRRTGQFSVQHLPTGAQISTYDYPEEPPSISLHFSPGRSGDELPGGISFDAEAVKEMAGSLLLQFGRDVRAARTDGRALPEGEWQIELHPKKPDDRKAGDGKAVVANAHRFWRAAEAATFAKKSAPTYRVVVRAPRDATADEMAEFSDRDLSVDQRL